MTNSLKIDKTATSWQVPDRVNRITVTLFGGGQTVIFNKNPGDVAYCYGGITKFSLDVTPGERFRVDFFTNAPAFGPDLGAVLDQPTLYAIAGAAGTAGFYTNDYGAYATRYYFSPGVSGGGDAGDTGTISNNGAGGNVLTPAGPGTQTEAGAVGTQTSGGSGGRVSSKATAGRALYGGAGMGRAFDGSPAAMNGGSGGGGWFGGGGGVNTDIQNSSGGGGSSKIQVPGSRNPLILENSKGTSPPVDCTALIEWEDPTQPGIYVKSGGTWVQPKDIYVFNGGKWKGVREVYIKVNGVWKPCYAGTPGTVNEPTITSPANGTSTQDRTLTITSSPFTSNTGLLTHATTSWEVYEGTSGANLVYSLYDSPTALTSLSIPQFTLLNSEYRVRVKYTATTSQESTWSQFVNWTELPVTPDIVFTQNLPPTVNKQAGGDQSNVFEVTAVDRLNRNTTIRYQWYWNGIAVTNATSSTWGFTGIYYSDNNAKVYTVATGTNSSLSSSKASDTTTFVVAPAPNDQREYVTDEQLLRQIQQLPSGGSPSWSSGNDEWVPLAGYEFAKLPAGSASLRIRTCEQDGKTIIASDVGLGKNGFSTGQNCGESGEGTNCVMSARFALVKNNTETVWSDYGATVPIENFRINARFTYNYVSWRINFDKYFDDLDPTASYILIWQFRKTRTNLCDCRFGTCVDEGFAGNVSWIATGGGGCIQWGANPFFNPYNRPRPTPTPPG